MVGPVITAADRDRIAGLVADGVAAGGRIVAGGPDIDMPSVGFYSAPTVVHVPDNSNPIAQREVFGPVITLQGYGDVDEAVAIANDTEYGLSNGIYTDDLASGSSRAPAAVRHGADQPGRGQRLHHDGRLQAERHRPGAGRARHPRLPGAQARGRRQPERASLRSAGRPEHLTLAPGRSPGGPGWRPYAGPRWTGTSTSS